MRCKDNTKCCKNISKERVIKIQVEDPFQSRKELGFA